MSYSSSIPDSSRWRVVVISAVAVFIIFGIRLSFSVFFAEFVTQEGWSNEAAATIFSLNMLVFGISSPLAGILLDRYGPRLIFTVGAILLAIGLFVSSRATSLQDLTLAYGILGGMGLAVIGLGPVAANISAWIPPSERGRAIGIAFAGTGFGSLFFVPFSNFLIQQLDWRSAYLVLSLICCFILAPLLAFGLRNPPTLTKRKEGISPVKTDWGKLLRNPIFWALMIVALNALGPVRSITVHQVAYMESIGIDRQTSANIVGLAGFLTAGTFITWGWVSDRWGRMVAFNLGALSLIIAVAILFTLRDSQMMILLLMYAIFYALGEGSRSSQTTALASDVFQNQGLGFINGLVGGMFGIGAAIGPWLVGRIKDQTGQYDGGLAIVVLMVIISMFAFVFIAWKNQKKG